MMKEVAWSIDGERVGLFAYGFGESLKFSDMGQLSKLGNNHRATTNFWLSAAYPLAMKVSCLLLPPFTNGQPDT